MNRRVFSGSRMNRDRREQSFARSVIAIAQRLRLDAEKERCLLCNEPLSGNCEVRDDAYPYCSKECGLAAEIEKV